jgi:hypothetical protein
MPTLIYLIGAFSLVFLLAEVAKAAGLGEGRDTAEDLDSMVDASQNPLTVKIAQAIAHAEGFFVSDPNARPRRNHNPGDMTSDLVGRGIGKDGSFIVFATDADGWANLYAQVNAWLNGTSRFHSGQSSIADLAGLGDETGYTSTDQVAWANTVAAKLNVSIDTSLAEIG